MKDFKWVILSNQIKDCPVTSADVEIANTIWGKNIAALKGKTTRTKPDPVAGNPLRVPKEFMKLHRDVYLTADVFFVNGIIFFISLSRKVDFPAVSHIPSRNIETIFKSFKSIYRFYIQRGFRIIIVHADGEHSSMTCLVDHA